MIYLIVINIISFLSMGLDKFLAIISKRRISENTLLFLALVGGGLGTLIGMFIFRHKIRKLKFQIIVPLSLIIFYIIKTTIK